jgi:ribosomal protein L40E
MEYIDMKNMENKNGPEIHIGENTNTSQKGNSYLKEMETAAGENRLEAYYQNEKNKLTARLKHSVDSDDKGLTDSILRDISFLEDAYRIVNKGGNSKNIIKICPKCGIEYENSAKFCRKCGSMLVLMQCARCGEVFLKKEDGSFDNFCMKCGQMNPLEQAKQALAEEDRKKAEELRIAEEKSKAKESSKGTKWLVIMAAAVLLCIGTGIFIWNKASNESTGSSSQNQTSSVTVNKPVHQRHPLVSPDSATVKKNYSVGDTIKFGSYPYSENGEEKAIEWQILEKYTNGTALVISKYALDNVKYNEKDESVTWETSTIRKWLNNDFYNMAFRNANKNLIVESYLENKGNTKWNTKGGNNTNDKIFLLSTDEARKYFSSDEKRKLWPTPYAKGSNSKEGNLDTSSSSDSSCWWWLRSPGSNQSYAAFVFSGGYVDSLGRHVYGASGAVRVALKINLNNL